MSFCWDPKPFMLSCNKKERWNNKSSSKTKRPQFFWLIFGSRLGAGRGVECLCYWSADHLCQCLEAGLRWVVRLYDTERVKGSSFQDAASLMTTQDGYNLCTELVRVFAMPISLPHDYHLLSILVFFASNAPVGWCRSVELSQLYISLSLSMHILRFVLGAGGLTP